ncbi:MAG TPA: hypothetical protein DC049_17505 [Spirochaetia bacterium]|nr:hypothetical protein [Spirochaetia bacterium]
MDILVLLKIFFWPYGRWTIREIASSICIGKTSVDRALKRMANVRLYDPASRKVLKKNLEEFILHGLPYVFPVQYGKQCSGIATVWSASPLKEKMTTGEKVVWPFAKGNARGKALLPLCPAVPKAALADNKLYEMLYLIDAYRAGKTRERELAREEIKKLLGNK